MTRELKMTTCKISQTRFLRDPEMFASPSGMRAEANAKKHVSPALQSATTNLSSAHFIRHRATQTTNSMQCARLARLPSVRCPVRRTDAGFAATSKYAGCRITRAPPSRAGAESSGPYMNEKYGWKFEEVKTHEGDTRVKILPVASIRRPFKGVRGNGAPRATPPASAPQARRLAGLASG